MKKMYHFFVVDVLTETIVGDFTAINVDVAKKILDETIKKNEKLQLSIDSLKLVYMPAFIDVPETFDEVKDICIDSKWSLVEVSN